MDDLARHKRYGRPALDSGVRLHVADGSAKADIDAGGGAREAEEERVVVRAVDMVVRRAVLGDQGAAPVAVPYALASIVAPEHDCLRLHGGGGKCGA